MITEQALLVLASLAAGELHGYGIAADVEKLSDGHVRLSAGTLYGVLTRLCDDGQIAESREEHVGGRRRRYYVLTDLGRETFTAEAARLSSMAAAVGARASGRFEPRPA